MSNRWLSSGRYGLTRGVFKRLWTPTPKLSEVIVPRMTKLPASPGGVNTGLYTEGNEPILTEYSEEIMAESA